MTHLISGATGALGQALFQAAQRHNTTARIAFGTRTPEALRSPGTDVRRLDYDDPASMRDAFVDVESLLLISTHADYATRKRQHRAAFEAARDAGVARVLFTSLVGADQPGDSVLLDVYSDAEQALGELGVPHVIMRNGIYLGLIPKLLGDVQAKQSVVLSAGEAAVSWISREDIADFALSALLDPELVGTYELVGSSYSMPQVVQVLAAQQGRQIEYTTVPHEVFVQRLSDSGMPREAVEGFSGVLRDMDLGRYQSASQDVATRLGRSALDLPQYLSRAYESWQAGAPSP